MRVLEQLKLRAVADFRLVQHNDLTYRLVNLIEVPCYLPLPTLQCILL